MKLLRFVQASSICLFVCVISVDSEFVEQATESLNSNSSSRYYLYGEPIPEQLKPFFPPPTQLLGQDLSSQLLWLTVSGSLSPLHYDLSEGILWQVAGEKNVVLVDPSYYDECAPSSINSPYDRQSTLPSLGPFSNDSPFATFNSIPRYIGVIKPGEALFIPYGWW